jgi:hypothetical protein
MIRIVIILMIAKALYNHPLQMTGIFAKKQGICTREQGAIEQSDFRMIFSEGTPHDDKEIAAACVDCCRT